MNKTDILTIATRTFNGVLGAENSSYMNSFTVQYEEEGGGDFLLFVPVVPTEIIIDEVLVQKFYKALAFALYPVKTVLAPTGVPVVATKNKNFNGARAIRFDLINGIPLRIKSVVLPVSKNLTVPIMNNYSIDFSKETSIAISGASGSGKTTFANYLIKQLKRNGVRLIAIDPKSDELTLLSKKLGLEYVCAAEFSNSYDFVEAVNVQLRNLIDVIYTRQRAFLMTEQRPTNKIIIVLDELIALISSAQKAQADILKSQLETIAVLGRSAGVSLMLISQDFNISASGISSTVRNQCSVRIVLGNLNKNSLQYLFPDIESVIVSREVGSGIIASNSFLAGQAYPLLAPTIG